MDYLLGRHFISLALILLFAIWLIAQRATRDKELRYFWLTLICCFFLILEDLFETSASLDPSLRFWRTLLSVAGYFLRSAATVGLVLVVCRPEQRRKTLWLPCLLNLLLCSTAFFTDLVFGFNEDYVFYRGPLGFVPFVVPLFYLGVLLWLTFRHFGDNGRKADQLILLPCAVLCLVSAGLDATRGGVRLHEAIMISCIFFYVFLRSYDVRRDSLTLLLNRQSLYEDCESLDKNICAAASLDMNGLKTINNAEGHRAGDEALKKIGETILATLDANMRAYRIGGDEFVILFSDMDEITVREKINRIRKSLEESGCSLSAGYVMREENEDPESLLRRSDLKMFENKALYYKDRRHDRRQDRRGGSDASVTEITKRKLEESPQPVAVCRFRDHGTEVLTVSDGFCRLFGFPDRAQALSVMEHDITGNAHPDDLDRLSGAILRFSSGKEYLDVVYRIRADLKTGWRVVHARGSLLHTSDDTRIAYVWFMDEGVYIEGEEASGTTINRALNKALHEESILHATHFDPLTGLPNLAWFFQLTDAGKEKLFAEGKQGCLLYMDLNGMKYFNHRYGFAEGDALLRSFAEILVKIFGREKCCHIAADRFVTSAPADEAESMVQRLFGEAERMNGGRTLPVRIGIYSTEMELVPVSSAFDRAKMACDAIRKSDSSGFNYYSTELRDEAKRHQYLTENIDKAIEERWIQAYYQPIIRSSDETLCDEEALARWIDPVEGFLSPASFVPLLEKAGLIYKLDLCVLDQTLEKIKLLEKAGQRVVPQSINLSRADFDACDIVQEIRRRVDAAGVSRSMITIEITESIIGSDFNFMKEQITRFQSLGFPVWMDDFGSGYSSLDVLQSIPFDLIKFDMSFMRKLHEGERGKIILTEMMKMASLLQVDTICEGVEAEEQVRFLQKIGCAKLQGYYFGKPAPFVPPEEPTPETAPAESTDPAEDPGKNT